MPSTPPLTVDAYLRGAVRRFQSARLSFGHGTSNAMDEAAYLILHTLGLPLDDLAGHAGRVLAPAELRALERVIARRIGERVPAAYLTGEAWLAGLPFYVDRRTIVPRSHIAGMLGEQLEPWLRRPVRRILDLCTGSGCLAILAARAFPRARVDAADLSRAALKVARRNVVRHGLGRRIRLRQSDLTESLERERYDLIISNPPYVTAASMRRLPDEYRHEPKMALAGGRDGLEFVSRILDAAPQHLTAGGLLVCEIGANRRALERAYPAMEFVWPELESGTNAVFLLEREQIVGASRSRT